MYNIRSIQIKGSHQNLNKQTQWIKQEVKFWNNHSAKKETLSESKGVYFFEVFFSTLAIGKLIKLYIG